MLKVYVTKTDAFFDAEFFEKAYLTLDETRRKKVENCRQQKDKVRVLAAGVLFSYALKKEQIICYDLCYGVHGKPYLKNRKDLYFNLSHSGNYAVCAICNCEVGIDIQEEKEIRMQTAKRFFLQSEYERILQITDEKEKKRIFHRLWAQKESFIKMTGMGLAEGLDSFYIDEDAKTVTNLLTKEISYLQTYELAGYQMAACTRQKWGSEETEILHVPCTC